MMTQAGLCEDFLCFYSEINRTVTDTLSGKLKTIKTSILTKFMNMLNEILIKTNDGRYGNLGPFYCPVCSAHYYATIDDNNPEPSLYVASYGEQPASLLDCEGRKRSEEIPLLYKAF